MSESPKKYLITKASPKNPMILRTIKTFDDEATALKWAQRYIFKDDKKLFVEDSEHNRIATVEYAEPFPILHQA